MSLLAKIYEKIKEKRLNELEIKLKRYKRDNYHLNIILFPKSYKIEKVSAREPKNTISYSTLICYNAFDTFLIDNPKWQEYKKYFELEPLKTYRAEIEKIWKEGDLENSNYIRMAFLDETLLRHKKILNQAEIENAITFFVEIFQDKLKNPNGFCYKYFSTLLFSRSPHNSFVNGMYPFSL
jgi:hypothetical protein